MTALAPCPFCGGKAERTSKPNSRIYVEIGCNECEVWQDMPTEAEAIAAWNRRAPAVQVAQGERKVSNLRSIDNLDRNKIARIVCGGDAECDIPCDDCPVVVFQEVNRVLAAIAKAGFVVMKKVTP